MQELGMSLDFQIAHDVFQDNFFKEWFFITARFVFKNL